MVDKVRENSFTRVWIFLPMVDRTAPLIDAVKTQIFYEFGGCTYTKQSLQSPFGGLWRDPDSGKPSRDNNVAILLVDVPGEKLNNFFATLNIIKSQIETIEREAWITYHPIELL